MKTRTNILVLSTLIFSFVFASCGPSKKLVASRAWVSQLQQDSTTTHGQLKDCNTQVKTLSSEKAALQNQNASVNSDLKTLAAASKMTIADQAKRMSNLQNMIQAQKDVMSKLKNSISDALLKYKADELSKTEMYMFRFRKNCCLNRVVMWSTPKEWLRLKHLLRC